MKNYPEYQLSKQIAYYLRAQYPKVLFHFDLTGANLSLAAAGKNKALQHSRGWPDLFIAEARGGRHGLFIEIKTEGTKLYKRNGEPINEHIKEQLHCLLLLDINKYTIAFGIGFDNCKKIIDDYLNNRL
jgi:hypothetical protein